MARDERDTSETRGRDGRETRERREREDGLSLHKRVAKSQQVYQKRSVLLTIVPINATTTCKRE